MLLDQSGREIQERPRAISAGLRVSGEFHITVRDAKTLEIKREYVEPNTVTHFMYDRWVNLNTIDQGALASADSYITLYISNRKLSPVASLMRPTSFFTKEDIHLAGPTWVDGSPDYMEVTGRFNPPVVTRTINTIWLGDFDTTFNAYASAYAALTSPCSQTPTEVLDVTYRVQAFYQPSSVSGLPTSDRYGYHLARTLMVYGTGAGSGYALTTADARIPLQAEASYYRSPPISTYRHSSMPDVNNLSVRTANLAQWKIIHTITRTTAQDIGRVFQSILYGVRDAWSFSPPPNAGLERRGATAWTPAVPPSFTGSGKPIQPIHNHNANAIEPFLDVDFLSTSQGFATVFGAGWTNPDYPEFYRVEYQNSGAITVGRYFFRKRVTVGFTDTASSAISTYKPRLEKLIFKHKQGVFQTPVPTIPTHGYDSKFIYEYDVRKLMTFDSTGITISDIVDATVKTFDSTTTPALSCTDIKQIVADISGNIWVACASSGLFKINTPFGVPTITHFTNGVHGIPLGSDNTCYAVSLGYNGSIWAAFNGGLSRTDTGGTTWVNHDPLSVPIFSFTGITNSLWSNITELHADPQSPTHQLAIISTPLGTPGTGRKIVWWSYVTAATGATTQARDHQNSFRVSFRGGFWGFRESGVGTEAMKKMPFNSLTGTDILAVNGPIQPTLVDAACPIFFYDYYGTPYSVDVDSGTSFYGLASPESDFIDTLTPGFDTPISGSGQHIMPSLALERSSFGLAILTCANSGSFATLRHDVNGHHITQVCSRLPLTTLTGLTLGGADPLNARYSPLEEIIWERYHWNGAAWIKNYYSQATDTGGLAVHAARHNFDTESHTFTGRSLIDVVAAFPSGTFGNPATATFAFRLIPTAKLGGATVTTPSQQEFQRTILSIEDATQRLRIIWSNSLTASLGSIIIETATTSFTIAATPADGGTYRFVVTVNGTSLKVYNNGVQIGSTVTLPVAYNWSNTGGDLKVHVGATVYSSFFSTQRHSIMPTNFYRGVMTNVQFWTGEWNAADVTSDNAAPTGVLTSPSPGGGAIIKARYELTQSLVGLETKPTHVSTDVFFNGINIKFDPGMSGTDFIVGDYLTFGVLDGILKDNATTFTQRYSLYIRPVDFAFASFTNATEGTTVPAVTTQVTERAVWSGDRITGNLTGPYSSTPLGHTRPGQIANNTNTTTPGVFTTDRGGVTAQNITADGYIEFRVASSDEDSIVGLTTTPASSNTGPNLNFGIQFTTTGSVNIRELNVIPGGGTAITTYVAGDTFKVQRVGSTITYYKGVTLLYTSLVSSAGTLHGRFVTAGGGYSIFNTIINYTRPINVVTVGSLLGLTGSFDPDFLRVETEETQTISVSLNAVPIAPSNILISDVYVGIMTAPGPGQVVINGELGWLVFNTAQQGQIVTGSVSVIFDSL